MTLRNEQPNIACVLHPSQSLALGNYRSDYYRNPNRDAALVSFLWRKPV